MAHGKTCEANGFTDAQTAQLHADILTAIEPVTLALQGGIKGKASNKQSNGLTPALLLRCAKDYGWTIPATLDSPIATLLLTTRGARTSRKIHHLRPNGTHRRNESRTRESPSQMSDSRIDIRVDADVTAAKQALADVTQQTQQLGETSERSAKALLAPCFSSAAP